MKSYAHQSMSRKRIKKLAAQLTDEEIKASLGEGETMHYYIDERGPLVGLWTASGPMTIMCDDDVLVYAQLDFMRRHNYPSFRKDSEIMDYAAANGWPGSPKGAL